MCVILRVDVSGQRDTATLLRGGEGRGHRVFGGKAHTKRRLNVVVRSEGLHIIRTQILVLGRLPLRVLGIQDIWARSGGRRRGGLWERLAGHSRT